MSDNVLAKINQQQAYTYIIRNKIRKTREHGKLIMSSIIIIEKPYHKGDDKMKNNIIRNLGLSVVLLTAAFLVASCGSSNKSSNPSPPPAGSGHGSHFHTVTISNFTFSPAALPVAVGDTVLWTNDDGIQHTVTADGGTFNGGPLSPGSEFQHVFGTAGAFPYHCNIHTFMHGSVTVQ